MRKRDFPGGSSLELHAGDITKLAVDAIVNAANAQLAPGGGVCGAIHRAAGPKLAEACAALSGCPTGEARITAGFDLPASHVIHAVGPVWQGGAAGEPEQLAGCYRSAMELLKEKGLRSIAFPAISTGIYGYPLEAACQTAVETLHSWLAGKPESYRVILTVFGVQAEEAMVRALKSLPG